MVLRITKSTRSFYTKKTLIISKSDIIPFSMNQNKIIDWLQNVYKIKDNIIFLSAKKNKNINLLISNGAKNLISMVDWKTSYGADFENITFNSDEEIIRINGTNFGFLVINAIYTYGNNNPVYNFKNITNNVNLENEGTCTGVFIGSGPCFNVKTTLNFEILLVQIK